MAVILRKAKRDKKSDQQDTFKSPEYRQPEWSESQRNRIRNIANAAKHVYSSDPFFYKRLYSHMMQGIVRFDDALADMKDYNAGRKVNNESAELLLKSL